MKKNKKKKLFVYVPPWEFWPVNCIIIIIMMIIMIYC